jgi:hypothetical protein
MRFYTIDELNKDAQVIAIKNVIGHEKYCFREALKVYSKLGIHQKVNNGGFKRLYNWYKRLNDIDYKNVESNRCEFLSDGTYIVFSTNGDGIHSLNYKDLMW